MNKDMPSLREMRIFVAVYEERSFTAAAEREHATQSGVSHHVRNIEERLGTQLFQRQRGVVPTPAGTAYYQSCLEVLRWHAQTLLGLADFAQGLAGRLAVGLMPAMTYRVLARACLRFQSANPNVTVKVVEAYSATLVDRVLAGELDFAIVPDAQGLPSGLARKPFVRTPECLVSARDGGLAHGRPVQLRDSRSLKLVLPSEANPFRAVIDQYLASQAVDVRRLEMDAILGVFDLVQRSDWMTILPGVMLADELAMTTERQFTVNPLVGPTLWFDMQVVQAMTQQLSLPAAAFLDVLREATREQQPDLPQDLAPGRPGIGPGPGPESCG